MFGQTTTDQPKKKSAPPDDAVKRLQEYAKKQQQEEEEKKKKKKEGVDTSPTPGIFDRLYKFYQGMKTPKKEQPDPPKNITGVRG